jgi:hypothetical protein
MLIHAEFYIKKYQYLQYFIPLHASYGSSSYTIIRAITSQIKTTTDITDKKATMDITTKSFIFYPDMERDSEIPENLYLDLKWLLQYLNSKSKCSIAYSCRVLIRNIENFSTYISSIHILRASGYTTIRIAYGIYLCTG